MRVNMKRKALIVGGSNGIGLAIAHNLWGMGYSEINILDRSPLNSDLEYSKFSYHSFNLTNDDFTIFENFVDIDTLIISTGLGRVASFNNITETEIVNSFKVNSIAVIRIIKLFYDKIHSNLDFNCAVMGSVAGLISSPLFSIYGASKAAVCKFIESINIELDKSDGTNRILNVSPGQMIGTRFYGGNNDLLLTSELAEAVLNKMFAKETLFIPDYESVYRNVLQRYSSDPYIFGMESYDCKIKSARLSDVPQVKVGYLSGTFDLFHIGHLNLLRRAKEHCDYLIVGVHKDASHKGKTTFIPYEERVKIVENIKYVDRVMPSLPEDSDAYDIVKYDYLFVGSDYKGTNRFKRYEEFFKDKDVEIIYLPYTSGTSSTELRSALKKFVANQWEARNL